MSQLLPNDEERNRMVNDAVKQAMRNAPELAGKPQDDVEKLFTRFMSSCIGARDRVKEKVEHGIQTTIIHTPKGKAQVLRDMHEELLSVLKDFNREELLFLLSWQQANWIMQEYV